MEIVRGSFETCPLETDTVVAIDVLRAFSTAAYALAAGVESIALVATVEEAFALKDRLPGVLLMGEVGGLPIEGFDFGNSPAPFETLDLRGRRMVQRTSAGTQGIVGSRRARHLLGASFCCAGATVEYLRRLGPERVALVPTGRGDNAGQGDEDVACADYLAALLKGKRPDPKAYLRRVRESRAGLEFLDQGQPDFPLRDLERSTEIDRFPFCPCCAKGRGPSPHEEGEHERLANA
jgi:2-phosphosulfolactate phosphatase